MVYGIKHAILSGSSLKIKVFNNIHTMLLKIILFCALLPNCASVSSGLQRQDIESAAPASEYKPTFSYQMLKAGVKLSGYKKIYADDAETVIKRTRKFNKGLRQLPPHDFYHRFIVTATTINERPCFLITPKKNAKTDRVVVFLYGGGFLLGIDFYHWNAIEYLLTELAVPVYVPLYPVYPEKNPDVIMAFINEVFAQVYATYPQARIIGMGDSSGAIILLGYCHYLSETNAERFPDRLILVSPAQVMGIDEPTLNKMKDIGKVDIGISVDILENLPLIFNMREDDVNWFNTPLYGDFNRFPPVFVFMGTHDLFYPLMRPFAERVKSQGKEIELYAGVGMMHDWPYMPIASESKHALDAIAGIIRGD